MLELKGATLAALLLGSTALDPPRTNAQDTGPATATPDTRPAEQTVITGEAFSAVKYTRTVQVQPSGKRPITAEGHHTLLARDTSGRIFMSGAGRIGDDCDLPSLGKLPPCPAWSDLIYDPQAGTITHWADGEIGDKTQYAVIRLSDGQLAKAERLTSVLEKPAPESTEPGVTVQLLGERLLEGVKAAGLRTTVTHAGPNGKPATTIHEVWISEKLRLVLRVVDGDPHGQETVSGLSHISLAPDPALFQSPTERILRQSTDGRFAEGDMKELQVWFAK